MNRDPRTSWVRGSSPAQVLARLDQGGKVWDNGISGEKYAQNGQHTSVSRFRSLNQRGQPTKGSTVDTNQWFTNAATRCRATSTSPYRNPIQCTRDAHVNGPHVSLYTNTGWADR